MTENDQPPFHIHQRPKTKYSEASLDQNSHSFDFFPNPCLNFLSNHAWKSNFGYIKFRLYRKNTDGPLKFDIARFHCISFVVMLKNQCKISLLLHLTSKNCKVRLLQLIMVPKNVFVSVSLDHLEWKTDNEKLIIIKNALRCSLGSMVGCKFEYQI